MTVLFNRDKVQLSEEQETLISLLENTSSHVFVTGKAGSGKSMLLKEFKKRTRKRVVITAPTGIAALNAEGQTIHSLFRFGPQLEIKNGAPDKTVRQLLLSIDVLIIDEISMVRADLMDNIDKRLRQARNSRLPFGGVRLVMFGDLYQLPPIVSDDRLRRYLNNKYGGIYFFNAQVWQKTSLNIYELSAVYRQADDEFKNILNEVRHGKISNKSLSVLNNRTKELPPQKGVIILAATNKAVNQINEARLNQLTTKAYLYKSKKSRPQKDALLEQSLRLKVGAQIMFTKNDPFGRWVNGSLGQVSKLSKSRIRIKVGSKTYELGRVSFTQTEYLYNSKDNKIEEKITNEFKQYPIKLAWAVTIHKSQGQTYSSCAIDLKNGVFASGQAYVSLSRVKSLDGLYLLSPIMQSDISIDNNVTKFMEQALYVSGADRTSNFSKQPIKRFKLRVFKSK